VDYSPSPLAVARATLAVARATLAVKAQNGQAARAGLILFPEGRGKRGFGERKKEFGERRKFGRGRVSRRVEWRTWE